MTLVQKEIKKVYLGSTQVRPIIPPYLCFTANTAGSTVRLGKAGSPTTVTLETSTDLNNWSTYTIGNTITLSNVGDKVYFRNSSTTDTGFSVGDTNLYNFTMSGSISGSGNISYLLNKNGTDSLSAYCFYGLFSGCSSLTTSPELPISNLAERCYGQMFYGCTSLTTLPKLPATSLTTYGYMYMFYGCSKIKLSATQTGEYQTPYRIPTTGTGTVGTNSLYNMFQGTGGTFTGTPTINTTYYTSNTVV